MDKNVWKILQYLSLKMNDFKKLFILFLSFIYVVCESKKYYQCVCCNSTKELRSLIFFTDQVKFTLATNLAWILDYLK